MENSFNKLFRSLADYRRPWFPSLRRRHVEEFLAKQANFICDDWTIAARDDRRLLARRAS